MKKRAAIFCVFCAIMLCLCACSNHTQSDEATPVEETSETTTKESTTAEDTDATFYEEETRKVYPGLNKGDPNEYPYKIATYTTIRLQYPMCRWAATQRCNGTLLISNSRTPWAATFC